MSILDGILGQVSATPTVQNLAAKVGLSPEQVEQAVAALGQAHTAEGDTVTTAAEQTGLPESMVRTYIAEICRKLGLPGREEAIQYAKDNFRF